MKENLLVTGGAGYIGSHAVLECLAAGHRVVVLDNLCNASRESLSRVEGMAGRAPVFIHGDVRDQGLLQNLFEKYEIDAVMHFSGLKSVSDSLARPLEYYDNNVGGTLCLCHAMEAAGVGRLVFSSSATVYGDPEKVPINENCPTGAPTNPYGESKLIVENMLRRLARADARKSIALLRYFNPIGAHPSGLIGEDSHDTPNNLLPFVSGVAAGRLSSLPVYGRDYPTKDGTGVRDYIHVMDLVSGHLAALEYLRRNNGVHTWNLGTGNGYSVHEVVTAFERVSGRAIPLHICERRPGDIAECWSDPEKAKRELGWEARKGLEDMLADAWRWQSNNPDGYAG